MKGGMQRAPAISPRQRRRRYIKIGETMALQLAILTITLTAAGRAQDQGAVTPQQVQAKLAYCEICHGVDAQGFHGYYPIPRLAGQQITYIENELTGFVEHKRTNIIMFNVGHVLSPAMIRGLATDFHNLNPKPLSDGPKDLVPTGNKIFHEGVSDAGVPPCASCHGPEAKGDGQFPRLAGQLYPYIVDQLSNWSNERGEINANVMEPIAHNLKPEQVKAVAAYLSHLE